MQLVRHTSLKSVKPLFSSQLVDLPLLVISHPWGALNLNLIGRLKIDHILHNGGWLDIRLIISLCLILIYQMSTSESLDTFIAVKLG